MGWKHKRGDVVKTTIVGVETNCIVLSDYIEEIVVPSGEYFLGESPGDTTGYKIYSWRDDEFLYDSFLVLIGDLKVYAHYTEIR